MTLNAKKLVVLLVIAVIFIEARIWDVAHWLDRVGIVEWARHVQTVYLIYPSHCTSLFECC